MCIGPQKLLIAMHLGNSELDSRYRVDSTSGSCQRSGRGWGDCPDQHRAAGWGLQTYNCGGPTLCSMKSYESTRMICVCVGGGGGGLICESKSELILDKAEIVVNARSM
jgi:hypothetical protein